ncbi:MAG: hypothetical protein GIW97_00120 [Candidatus Eremiobacteraeota bacterium]|nr:hypothetical protein [Candidatus Eremiobacteraeota bacterium]
MRHRIFGLMCTLVWLTLGLPAAAAGEPVAQVLAQIRHVFRSHEVPPYVSYTIQRDQMTDDGLPDLLWSYTYRVWFRSADRAALGRKRFRGRSEDLEFMRPAFNEPRDPGPPTADLFEPAPVRPTFGGQPFDRPPAIPEIGAVTSYGELDYRVSQMKIEGMLLHLWLFPLRDAERNRLRELWVDSGTLELQKVIATDRLYSLGGRVYMMMDTITMGRVEGRPVVTDIHGRANFADERWEAGFDVDYHFRDIAFPSELPLWYFEPPSYGKHIAEAPQ